MLEIGEKWEGELRGKRAGRVLELMVKMFEKNQTMVFWANLQELFPVFTEQILRLKENLNSYGVALNVQKILRILEMYYSNTQLKRIKLKQKPAENLCTALEGVSRKIKLEFHMGQRENL